MTSEYTSVGQVKALFIYPVKSMRGQSVESVRLGWQGMEDDRRLALLRVGDTSGLPWASARETPELLGYSAMACGGAQNAVSITDPAGNVRDAGDPSLLAELETLVGARLSWIHLWRGAFDAMPVSLLTTNSLNSVRDLCGVEDLAPMRFRPNILVETDRDAAFPEEKWESRSLLFGTGADPARIRLNRKDVRCKIVDLNPETGAHDASIHKAIIKERRNRLGMYASTERCGEIRVGDLVQIGR